MDEMKHVLGIALLCIGGLTVFGGYALIGAIILVVAVLVLALM
jgi:hypothetical protein